MELNALLGAATHYELLGIDVGASSREVTKAFIGGSWDSELDRRVSALKSIAPWTADELATVERRRREAFDTLDNPATRAVYDGRRFTREQIRAAIEPRLEWGKALAFGIGLLAFFCLMSHDNVSRWAGLNLAPSFSERRIYVDEERCEERGNTERCVQGYYESEFRSRDPRWNALLNSWVAMSLVPATLLGVLAFAALRWTDGLVASLITNARLSGMRDAVIRQGIGWTLAMCVLGSYVYLASYGLGRH